MGATAWRLAATLAVLAACSHPRAPSPQADPCVVGVTQAAGDTIRIVLSGPVDPSRAPSPRTEAERLLFPQVYETLLRADCRGRLLPGLASSWSRLDALRWRVRLRPGLRFWDGVTVTAPDVARSLGGPGGETARLWARGVAQVSAPDDSTLILLLTRPRDEFSILADPLFAVARDIGGVWPLGTGRFGLRDGTARAIVAVPFDATSRDALPVLQFLPARDSRDALDRGADLLITDDPVTLEYARAIPSLETVALPWNRTYVLLVPIAVAGPARDIAAQVASAVRADARPPEPPYWWTVTTRCDEDPGEEPQAVTSTTARIAYARDDPTAALLAERLVALSAAGALAGVLPGVSSGSRLVAAGLEPAAFGGAVSTGHEAGYVLPLPHQPLDPCVDHAAMFQGLPWLDDAQLAAHILPLIDTRRHAVFRHGRTGIGIGRGGTVYLLTR